MSGLSIPVPRALTQSFPPELIRRILELAIENWSDWNSASTRLTLLRNASLVCKIWSLEAQSLLWSNLVIWDDRRALAKRVLSSSALGKFRTPGLALWSCEESLEVIAGLKGVEDLFIGSYEVRHGLTSAVFSFPSLKDLTSLTLYDDTMTPTLSTFPVFSLRKLQIKDLRGPSPFPWSYLFTPSLTHLTIDHPISESIDHLIEPLTSVAPHLQKFTLYFLPPPTWNSIFTSCFDLTHLKLATYMWDAVRLLSIIKSLPPNQLKSLSIIGSSIQPTAISHSIKFLTQFLDCISLGRITRISLHGVARKTLYEESDGEKVLKKWEERGVSVKFMS